MKNILILIFISSGSLFAQIQDTSKAFNNPSSNSSVPIDSIKAIYERETLFINPGYYIKNGKSYKNGFFNIDLNMELRKHKDAAEESKKYMHKIIRGTILSVGGYVGIYLVATTKDQWPLMFYFFVPISFGLWDIGTSTKHLSKAIWLYNRDAVIAGAKRR